MRVDVFMALDDYLVRLFLAAGDPATTLFAATATGKLPEKDILGLGVVHVQVVVRLDGFQGGQRLLAHVQGHVGVAGMQKVTREVRIEHMPSFGNLQGVLPNVRYDLSSHDGQQVAWFKTSVSNNAMAVFVVLGDDCKITGLREQWIIPKRKWIKHPF